MEPRRPVLYKVAEQKSRSIRWTFGWLFLFFSVFFHSLGQAAQSESLELKPEQRAWLTQHKEQSFSVGFDPFGGVDSFELRGQRMGFLHLLLADIQKRTGLKLTPAESTGWDDAYSRFVAGKIDVLYGANATPEREKIMRFTAPAQRYPYVVLAPKDGTVQALADMDGKRLGFIDNDFVLEALPPAYPNIRFNPSFFADQNLALAALKQNRIDAFVTSGGGVEVEYLVNNPELGVIAKLRAITSDMTLAVLHKDAVLASILESYLRQSPVTIEWTLFQTQLFLLFVFHLLFRGQICFHKWLKGIRFPCGIVPVIRLRRRSSGGGNRLCPGCDGDDSRWGGRCSGVE